MGRTRTNSLIARAKAGFIPHVPSGNVAGGGQEALGLATDRACRGDRSWFAASPELDGYTLTESCLTHGGVTRTRGCGLKAQSYEYKSAPCLGPRDVDGMPT